MDFSIMLFVFSVNFFLTGETTRQAKEYKIKLQRTEQEIVTLEGNVSIILQ